MHGHYFIDYFRLGANGFGGLKMIIKINNDYQVEAQKYNNWALQRVTDSKGGRLTDKLGKSTPKAIGYYPDLSSALKAFYTQRLIDDN